MDDALSMCFAERVGYLRRYFYRFLHRERAAREAKRERFALDVFHHDEPGAAMLAYIVYVSYVGRPQSGRGARLLQEPGASVGVILIGRRKELQRDLSSEPYIFGEKDLAHSALAELSDNSIMRNNPSAHLTSTSCLLLKINLCRTAGEYNREVPGRERRRPESQDSLSLAAV